MNRASRVAKLEQAKAMTKDALERIAHRIVDPTSNGPIFTGRVHVYDLEAGTNWTEDRMPLAGTSAKAAKGVQHYAA